MINDFHQHGLLHAWHDGGCVLIPLFLLALFIGYHVSEMLIYFARSDCKDSENTKWNDWIKQPDQAQGEGGEIIRYSQAGPQNAWSVRERFLAVRSARLPRLNQRLVMLSVAVTAAPLLGLLGTVLGMLETFEAIGETSGNTLDRMSHGISEALITTEVGLIIAVTGFFGLYLVRRQRNRFREFLYHLENLTLQHCQQS
ncbi:MAG: biopolymer transport protein ExbB [Limisphaerales bacterium]|jgi:biopolymer transport protein ExbB